MKYLPFGFLLIFIMSSSCVLKKENNVSKIISVSILPQKYLADKITGGKYEVNVLIPSGASPASYEPSPLQISHLNNSALYFRIGEIIFEKSWIEKISQQNPDLRIVNLSDGIEFIGSQAHHHSEDDEKESDLDHHEHEQGKDPHIWMSPKNMKIISKKMFSELSETYPEDSVLFAQNYHSLLVEINNIDSLYTSSSSILSGINFLIYHPALAYLAQDYDMTQHVLEFEGKEPGPAHIASIIKIADDLDIQFIFVQRQFSLDNAKSLAEEIDAEIIMIDPLAEDWHGQLLGIHNILVSK